jgi:transcriptional regulator with XRE-family HTH domain
MANRDAAALAGTELRRARNRRRQRQRDVAEAAGCSQATISRLESGRGSSFSMAVWSAVAGAVDCRLAVDLSPRTAPSTEDETLTVRCHRALCELSRLGGWSAVTVIERRARHEIVETILERGPERVVVHAWEVVSDVERHVDALVSSVERQTELGAPSAVGLAIVPSTSGNRRRMTEAADLLRPAFPTFANAWYGALRNPARPTPVDHGVLWTDRHGERVVPAHAVPGWAWTTPDHASRALRRSAG